MAKSSKKSSARQTSLFDIRLRSPDRDVIVLKGPESEASSALFSGVIALSVVEPLTIKKMSLKLFATLRLSWDDKVQTSNGTQYNRPVRFSKILFDFEWDQLNLNEFLNKKSPLSSSFDSTSSAVQRVNSSSGFTTGKLTRSNQSSSSSLKSLGTNSKSTANLIKSHKSSSNLSSLNLGALTSSSNKSDTVTLPVGNYEFPFQTILDGSIPESIEGLPGCSLVYRLQSTIERGRFVPALVTKRHVHVIRTLASDAADLTETVAVDNTWPGKVDYSISVPTKSMAIGSKCPIEIIMVPLMKGLKLGTIKIKLIENYTYSSNAASHVDERVITSRTVQKPTVDQDGKDIWADSEMDINGVFFQNDDMILAQDRWEVGVALQLPHSLSRTAQDCDVSHYVKVRHKLKFAISLVNSDGHVSELRATLPISLFISPFVPIVARPLNDFDDGLKYSNLEDVTIHYKGEEILFQQDGSNLRSHPDTPFSTPGGSAVDLTLATNTGAPIAETTTSTSAPNYNTQDLMAPPNYQSHVYDRVWSEVGTPMESPDLSGAVTPRAIDIPAGDKKFNAGTTLEELNMTPSESRFSSQLISNLTQLQTQRESDNGGLHMGSLLTRRVNRPVFSLNGDQGDDIQEVQSPESRNVEGDYFSFAGSSDRRSSGLTPGAANGASATSLPYGGTISGPGFSVGTSEIPTTPGHNLPLMSPGVMSPIQHLSRVNSFIHDPSATSPTLGEDEQHRWDGVSLSKVPSYETAMKAETMDTDMTPAYEPPVFDSQINLDLLDSRLRNVHLVETDSSTNLASTGATTSSTPARISRNSTSNTLQILSRNKEHLALTSGLAKSRGSSNNSSPTGSRDQSSANLYGLRNNNLPQPSMMVGLEPTSEIAGDLRIGSSTEPNQSLTTNKPLPLAKAAHVHTPSGISSHSSLLNMAHEGNSLSHIASTGIGSLGPGSGPGSGTASSLTPKKKPELVSRSSSSFHLHLTKNSSFASLTSILHKKEKDHK